MKRSTFRKSSLISSVALLLVAIVALSGATFAWFTTNETATADGVQAVASSASSLEIAYEVDGAKTEWASSIDYGFSETLAPASTANGTAWFQATAKDGSNGELDPDEGITTASGLYKFQNKLYIHNGGNEVAQGVKITVTGLTNDYARIAIVPAGGTFADSIYSEVAENWNGLMNANTSNNTTAMSSKVMTSVTVGPMEADAEAEYDVYVWFEGQDADCKNVNAGQSVGNLLFTVTADAPAQG